jgi:probable addiction module antidote protein
VETNERSRGISKGRRGSLQNGRLILAEKFGRYDTADYLDSEDAVRRYLEICQEEGDPSVIAAALGDIARAGNMSQLARDAGMTKAGLYKALSPDGNPSIARSLKWLLQWD